MDHYRRSALRDHNHSTMPGRYPTDRHATVEDEHEVNYIPHSTSVNQIPYTSRHPDNFNSTYYPPPPLTTMHMPTYPSIPPLAHTRSRTTPELRFALKLQSYNPLSDELLAPISLDMPHRRLAGEAVEMRRVLDSVLRADTGGDGRVRSGDKLDVLLKVVGHLMERMGVVDDVLFRMGQVLGGGQAGEDQDEAGERDTASNGVEAKSGWFGWLR
ncbi:hypothetical protein P153DRAFT_361867 [Dothidotthia symphoricarpi CBS 119687]|uniref:Uncharacterized protein n=1 Tax=Dothidotthia symphoricarpi CBS 119687 TaxID=1392245 RepID=A0A6A5ZZ89_9PLEO|nr:uncharacterized protein P153DRAFT_361867 [Dothidotthia symphoricarpi CBS 119687]KAF2123631.1 hypothetical protein P153DRAFT_361867 [Dothidotthia symphoricarpi CBS 119687]